MMFIHIKHGGNEQFLANTNCPVILLLQYMKAKLGIPESELVDLCDDQGALKMLFLSQQHQKYASSLLPARCSFIFCVVNRDWPFWFGEKGKAISIHTVTLKKFILSGNPEDSGYVSITPLVDNPEHALLETLQSQTNSMESARQRRLTSQEDHQATKIHPAKARSRAHADTLHEEPQRCTTSRRKPK